MRPPRLAVKPLIGIMLAVAILVVGVLALVVVVDLTSVSQLNTEEQRLSTQALSTCQRLNITRSTDNQAHLENYRLYQFITRRFLIPTKTETPAQLQVTATFATLLRADVRDSNWTPLVNCAAQPKTLQVIPVIPITFRHRLPPPSALSPRNAARSHPAGSVNP